MSSDLPVYAEERDHGTAGSVQQAWVGRVVGPVLELGASTGRNAALLPDGTSYVGLEVDPRACELAVERGRQVSQLDLDDLTAVERAVRPLETPATVLAIDVLEHLRRPEQTLAVLGASGLDRARWLVVVPNGVSAAVRAQVLRGRFPKRDSGIFDRTHLHFFDRDSLQSMIEAGLNPGRPFSVEALPFEVGGRRLSRLPGGGAAVLAARALLVRLARRWPAMWAYEYLVEVPPRTQHHAI